MENQKVNNYRIIEKIGSGAFGNTYKVNEIETNKIYAMKILKSEAMSNDIQTGGYKRFEREIKALRRVNCENTVKHIDNGVLGDMFHIKIGFSKFVREPKTKVKSEELDIYATKFS